MPTLEETMREALRRHTPARDAGEVFDRLADRRRRRTVARKLGTIGLVVAVLGGTVGAFAVLGHAFDTEPQPLGTPEADNGALVVSLQDEDGFSLYVLPPGRQDLAPAASEVAAGRDDMRHLTGTGTERDVDPTVTPDGATVAYARHASKDEPGGLWTIGIDGSRARQIVEPSVAVEDPAWSPDGAWIAFATPDGIARIPSEGGPAEVLVPASGVNSDRLPTQPAWSPDGRYLAFGFGPTSPLPPVVYLLPVGGATAFPLSQGWSFAWQPLPRNAATPPPVASPQVNLGLGYGVCRVTSMPIATGAGPGAAYVYSKAGDCAHGDGYVGVDVDNDGAVDATHGPLEDCFLRCEAFAAPDVNADGVSEVAVSTEGADGYGVYLFAVSTGGSPTIDPVHVEDPQHLASVLDPLEFAWADVAAHFEGARCGALPDGTPVFLLQGGDKLPPDADVRTTALVLSGSTATVVDVSTTTVPLADAPVPGNELCGTPLYNSAKSFPQASTTSDTDPGLPFHLCNTSSLLDGIDFGSGSGRAWAGTRVNPNGECPEGTDAELIVVADMDGDAIADTWATLDDCLYCEPEPYAAIDLDADGVDELIVREIPFSAPDYRIFALSPAGQLSAVLVSGDGHPENAFVAGEPAVLSAGGDAGIADRIACEGWPTDTILIQMRSYTPIDGATTTVHMSRVVMRDGSLVVLGSSDYEQPATDALPYQEQPSACGVQWGL
jgi:WD40-like Beta Propeller Repeat